MEVVGAGDGVLNARFLDIAYPNGIDLCPGRPLAGICFIVYISGGIFAGAVVTEPPSRGAAAAFSGAVTLFWHFSFFPSICALCFVAFATIAFSARASKVLLICVARVWEARPLGAVSVDHRSESGVLFDHRVGYPLGKEVQF